MSIQHVAIRANAVMQLTKVTYRPIRRLCIIDSHKTAVDIDSK